MSSARSLHKSCRSCPKLLKHHCRSCPSGAVLSGNISSPELNLQQPHRDGTSAKAGFSQEGLSTLTGRPDAGKGGGEGRGEKNTNT